ncbi:MAG: hypothetical protein K6B38_06860 [Ruminococcus sp.]|nr:hypothetical protein [Ruminococcus sp.]
MDDVMGKLGELLSDEESVRQLSELAQMMNDGTDEPIGGSPDMSGLVKLSGLIGTMNSEDSNTQLLMALRPHLKVERQERVDRAVKLMKLIAVWNAAKESGLLNDIL